MRVDYGSSRVDFGEAAAARLHATRVLRDVPHARTQVILQLTGGRALGVRISWTMMPGGHRRGWFHCPIEGCYRRVAHLYVGDSLSCRRCSGLAYPAPRFHRDRMWEMWGKAAYRLSKVRDQLRRPRIRLARRGRLEREAERLEAELVAGLCRYGADLGRN